jgi:hypothetical protein
MTSQGHRSLGAVSVCVIGLTASYLLLAQGVKWAFFRLSLPVRPSAPLMQSRLSA